MKTKITISHALPLFSFLLLSITFIFSFDYALSTFIFHGIFPYDQKRILQVFLLVSTSIIFSVFQNERNAIIQIIHSMRVTTKIALGLFLYLGLLSAIFAKIPMAGFLEWSLYVLLIFFALCWCVIALTLGEKFYFWLSGLIFLIIAVYMHPVIQGYTDSIRHHIAINLFPYFINPRFFTQFAVFTLALLPLADIFLLKKSFLKYIRILLFLLAGCWWALVILNGARGILYAFTIATLIGIIIFRKTLLPWIWRQACFIFLGMVTVFLFITSSITLKTHILIKNNLAHLNALNIANTKQRWIVYQYAVHLIKKHPWLGVGPMHFAYAEPNILIQTGNLAAHPHNVILLFLSEWGIPAGILFLLLIISCLFHFIKKVCCISQNTKNSETHCVIFASYAMSLGAGLLYSLVGGVTVMPLSQTMLSVIAGSCLALYVKENAALENILVEKSTRYYYLILFLILLGFSVSIVVWNIVSVFPHLTQSEIIWLQKHGLNTLFYPRFWLEGWLT